MQTPGKIIQKKSVKIYKSRNPLLFTIPNPFDDCLRKKTGWYEEVKRMEQTIKSVREKINLIAEQQKHQRRAIEAMREYCKDLKGRHQQRPQHPQD